MVIERIQGFVDHTVFRARGARFKELPHFGRESGGVGRVEQLADWLVSRVVGELGVSVAFLLVRDAERHAFAVMAYRGLTEPSLVVLGEDNPVLEWLGRRDHAVMLRDLRPLPQWRGLLERERQALERTRAELLVPLRSTRGLMAVLAVGGRLGGAPFSPEATRLLEDVAYEGAISVENARLSDQVGHQLEELRAVHQQMVRSAKLAVVGELAASVAHEVTNPLQAVMNLTYLLRRGLNQEDPQRADLQALISRLLRRRFSGPGASFLRC